MINGRMWLVVKPTIGVPLFLGGVVVASLAIHTAVLTHTTWYPAFLQGGTRRPVATSAIVPQAAPAALTNSQAADAPTLQLAVAQP
jgi:light-harvesting protein B-800-850 alpha chain